MWIIKSETDTEVNDWDSLSQYLINIEKKDSTSVKLQLHVQDEDLSTAFPPLFDFIVSKERTCAFDITLQGSDTDLSPYQTHLSTARAIQYHYLHVKRLRPLAERIIDTAGKIRDAKLRWTKKESSRSRLGLSMQQQQQQQQQQTGTHTRRFKPAPAPENTSLAPHVELVVNEIITSDNLHEKLDDYWQTLPAAQTMSLDTVWINLVGTSPERLEQLKQYPLRAPIVQAVEIETMKYILQHYPYFMGGVVAHNLPEHFFWYHDPSSQQWVLCREPRYGDAFRPTPSNPLTIRCRHDEAPNDTIAHWPLLHRVYQQQGQVGFSDIASASLAPEEGQQYALLFDPDSPTSEKKKAFRYFLDQLTQENDGASIHYINKKLDALESHFSTGHAVAGLGHILFQQGLVGIVVILSLLEKLSRIDAFSLFSETYLSSPLSYPQLLQADCLPVIEGILQLNDEIGSWWWALVSAQQPLGIALLKDDFQTFQYFVKEVHTLLGNKTACWPMAASFSIQPIQVTLSRALFILANAVYPEEQWNYLPYINAWGPLDAYFAVQQEWFRLITFEMRSYDNSNGYRVSKLADSSEKKMSARFLGMQTFRVGTWHEYSQAEAAFKQLIDKLYTFSEEIKGEQDALVNKINQLFLLLTTGEKAYDALNNLEKQVRQFTRHFTLFIRKYGYNSLECSRFLSEQLHLIEQEANTSSPIILTEWLRGLNHLRLYSQWTLEEIKGECSPTPLLGQLGENVILLTDYIRARRHRDNKEKKIPELRFQWEPFINFTLPLLEWKPAVLSRQDKLDLLCLVLLFTPEQQTDRFAQYCKIFSPIIDKIMRDGEAGKRCLRLLGSIDLEHSKLPSVDYFCKLPSALLSEIETSIPEQFTLRPNKKKINTEWGLSFQIATINQVTSRYSKKISPLLRDLRSQLPIAIRVGQDKFEKDKEKYKTDIPIIKHILNHFVEHASQYFPIVTALASSFEKTPYQIAPLEKHLEALGALTRKTLKTAAIPLKILLQGALLLPFEKEVGKLFFPEEKRKQAAPLTPFFRQLITWGFGLLDKKVDWLAWLRPLVETVFDMLRELEENPLLLEQETFTHLLMHLKKIHLSCIQIFNTPIRGRSLTHIIEEAIALAKESYFEHTTKGILSILLRPDLIDRLTPLLKNLWDITFDANDEDIFYEQINQFEKNSIDLLHGLEESQAIIVELLTYAASVIVSPDKSKPRAPSSGDPLPDGHGSVRSGETMTKTTYAKAIKEHIKQIQDWYRNPTSSILSLCADIIEKPYDTKLEKSVDRLNITCSVTKKTLKTISKGYLGKIDPQLSLGNALKEFQKKFKETLQLLTLFETIHHKFFHLNRDWLNFLQHYYEKKGPLNVFVYLSSVIVNSAHPSPQLIMQQIVELILEFGIQETQHVHLQLKAFADALHTLPQDQLEGTDTCVHLFERHVLCHEWIPFEAIVFWRSISGLNQQDLNRFTSLLIKSAFLKQLDEKQVKALVTFLNTYLPNTPEALRFATLMLNTPTLQEHFVSERCSRQPLDWMHLFLMFEQDATEQEWKTLFDLIKSHPDEALSELLTLFSYKPFPHKTRVLALLQDPTRATWPSTLTLMDQHAAWFAHPLSLSGEVAPSLPALDSLERVGDLLNQITDLLDQETLDPDIKQQLAEEIAHIESLAPQYFVRSRKELCAAEHLFREASDPGECQESSNKSARKVSRKKLEWIAILRELMRRTTGIFPNTTQLLAFLVSLHTEQNTLLQLSTGQGKAFLTALLAVSEWIRVGSVDVMTSNRGLVAQDYYDKGLCHFFAILKIPSQILFSEPGATHKKGINYTTPWDRSFIHSIARVENTVQADPYTKTACIVDESETLMLRMISISFDFVHSLSENNSLAWIYPHILTFASTEAFRLIDTKNPHTWSEQDDVVHLIHYIDAQTLSPEETEQWRVLKRDDDQLNTWLDAVCEVFTLKEGIDFLLFSDPTRQGYEIATPIIEGIPQPGAQFSEAVHPFLIAWLQQKYPDKQFEIPEEVIPMDTNYPLGLLSVYERIIGLSATLGEQTELLYLMSTLGTVAFSFPTHEPSKCEAWPDTLCPNEEQHLVTLAEGIKNLKTIGTGERQPILIVEEDANFVKALQPKLHAALIDTPITVQHLVGNEAPEDRDLFLQRASKPNTVTIVTTLYARGLDLKPEHLQGLFVIVACLKSEGLIKQAFGRGGRYGKPGLTWLLLDGSRYDIKHMDEIKTHQDLQIKQEAVERYFAAEAAGMIEPAIARFEQIKELLKKHVDPEQKMAFEKIFNSFRQQWLNDLKKIWKKGLEEANRDNPSVNHYVKFNTKGELETTVLEALLVQYPKKIQNAWLQFHPRLMEKITPCLSAINKHQRYQLERLLTVDPLAGAIIEARKAQEKLPFRPAATRSKQPWLYDPQRLALQAKIRYEKEEQKRRQQILEYASEILGIEPEQHSLETIFNTLKRQVKKWNESIVELTADKIKEKREQGLRLIAVSQKLFPCFDEHKKDQHNNLENLKNEILKATQLIKLHPPLAKDARLKKLLDERQRVDHSLSNWLREEKELAKDLSQLKNATLHSHRWVVAHLKKELRWAAPGSRTWRYWFSTPSCKRAIKDVMTCIEHLQTSLPIESEEEANMMLDFAERLAVHMKSLEGRWLFPWHRKLPDQFKVAHDGIRSLIEKPKDLLRDTTHTMTHGEGHYFQHTGFESRLITQRPPQKMASVIVSPDPAATRLSSSGYPLANARGSDSSGETMREAQKITSSNSPGLHFFKRWKTDLIMQRNELEQQILALKALQANESTLSPPENASILPTTIQSLLNTMSALNNLTETIPTSFDAHYPELEELITAYNTVRTLTFQNVGKTTDIVFSLFREALLNQERTRERAKAAIENHNADLTQIDSKKEALMKKLDDYKQRPGLHNPFKMTEMKNQLKALDKSREQTLIKKINLSEEIFKSDQIPPDLMSQFESIKKKRLESLRGAIDNAAERTKPLILQALRTTVLNEITETTKKMDVITQQLAEVKEGKNSHAKRTALVM